MKDSSDPGNQHRTIVLPFTPRIWMQVFRIMAVLMVTAVPASIFIALVTSDVFYLLLMYPFVMLLSGCLLLLNRLRVERVLARDRTKLLYGLGLTLSDVRREIARNKSRGARRHSIRSLWPLVLAIFLLVFGVAAVQLVTLLLGFPGIVRTVVAFGCAMPLGMLVQHAWRVQRRWNAPYVDALAKQIPGDFVVYLRSFKDDSTIGEMFDESPRHLMRHFIPSYFYIPSEFEHIALRTLSKAKLVVAIAPGHKPPPLFGNAVYVEERSWQARAGEYMQNAECIVVLLGDGIGLDWEMRTIFDRGYTGKTMFVLPPASPEGRARRWNHFLDLAKDQPWTPLLNLLDPTLLLTVQVSETGTLMLIFGPFDELKAYDEAISVGFVIINRGSLSAGPPVTVA
jgi:hypothetical protein